MRAHLSAAVDDDVAQNCCRGADEHIVLDLGMSVPSILARACSTAVCQYAVFTYEDQISLAAGLHSFTQLQAPMRLSPESLAAPAAQRSVAACCVHATW